MVIGVTGGIGSGKSTVTKILHQQGYESLIADEIAREIMTSDQNVIHAIKSHFGSESYEKGNLNTKSLANKVFNNPDQISKLNSIVHPPTIKKIEELIKDKKKNHKLIFVESALIFEAQMEYLFDYILLITAEEDTRIKRVLERGVETISEIRSRMLNQIPEEQKKKRSQFIIENNSTLEDLEDRTLFFLNLFKSMIQI